MKNVFITEEETINTGTKLIIRDIAQQQVGEHTEMLCLVKTEAGRKAHLERKAVGIPPSEEEHGKEGVNSFI